MKIGIIGLGLMGGSLGIAIKENLEDYYIIGLDHNKNHSKEALELDLVDEVTDSLDDIKKCDIIILSIPVDGIISIIQQLTDISPECTIIDLGSTKGKIISSIPHQIRSNFIPAHPMTGTEKFGPTASIKDLYKDKVIVLCDLEDSGEIQKNIAINIFTKIGMNIVFMNGKEHDRHAAFISHMPHAVSYALANSVMTQENSNSIIALAGGGFRDMSRIAKSSPFMWEDIFRQNKSNLLMAIDSFSLELQRCKEMVQDEEWEELNKWMSDANKLHDIL
ncbi:Prephenate and/or arogenate dehydrogenase (unknown specificity) [hydrothermal vent metagenome]|uniref:Prephenate/arogenate dehydrogenase domain-containing protein n=1 Tax=hydrothermal vent metagenome TaxID=652676 RepID=A0A1W1CAZ8_9ZZZZ